MKKVNRTYCVTARNEANGKVFTDKFSAYSDSDARYCFRECYRHSVYTILEVKAEESEPEDSEGNSDNKKSEYPIEPLPCPFCGTDVKQYPVIMIVEPVHSEEYLLAKLNKGHFLGTDNWYHVRCIRCGSTGARGSNRKEALERWNERGHSRLSEALKYNGVLRNGRVE